MVALVDLVRAGSPSGAQPNDMRGRGTKVDKVCMIAHVALKKIDSGGDVCRSSGSGVYSK